MPAACPRWVVRPKGRLVGEMGLGVHTLLAVDHPFVAVEFGLWWRATPGPCPGVGLTESLAPSGSSRPRSRENCFFCSSVPSLQDGSDDQGGHRRSQPEAAPRTRANSFVQHHLLEQRRGPSPRTRRAKPAQKPTAGMELLGPFFVERPCGSSVAIENLPGSRPAWGRSP